MVLPYSKQLAYLEPLSESHKAEEDNFTRKALNQKSQNKQTNNGVCLYSNSWKVL